MSGLSARAFNGSNRAQMGSNVFTTINQGGGDKKAGFPYMIGREYTCSHAMHYHTFPLKTWNTTVLPLAMQSRPISTTVRTNYRKFKYV